MRSYAHNHILPLGRSWGHLAGREHHGRKAPSVDARRIQTRGIRVQTEPRLRVVPEHDVRGPRVALRPGRLREAIAGGSVPSERPNMEQRPGLLVCEGNPRLHPGVHHAYVVGGKFKR